MDNKAEGKELNKGKLSYDDKVIIKVAGMATDEIEGMLTVSSGFMGGIADRFIKNEDDVKGVNAEVGEKQVALDINVVCEYGRNIPALYESVTSRVAKALMDTTGLALVELNMKVEDIMKKSELADLREKQRDSLFSGSKKDDAPIKPEVKESEPARVH